VEFPSSLDPKDTFLPKVECPNPGHDTLKRHFQINAEKPLVHCFANCGISGTYEHAISVIEGLYEKFDLKGAVDERERERRRLRAHREARRIILRSGVGQGVGISKPVPTRNSRPATPVPADDLGYERYLPPVALEYLRGRGISDASVATWNLGWDPEEKRLVIPAMDEQRIVKFLIRRAVLPKQNPQYLYTEGFPKNRLLFGAGQIDLGLVKSDGLVLVEGSIDTIMNHQHGLTNTVGILGTGISEQQRRIISRIKPPRIYLMFDKDVAGVHNIEIAAMKLRKYPLYVVRYPKGRDDPAEMTKEEKFRQIERSVPIYRFNFSNARRTRKEIRG
jgi:DNA primase